MMSGLSSGSGLSLGGGLSSSNGLNGGRGNPLAPHNITAPVASGTTTIGDTVTCSPSTTIALGPVSAPLAEQTKPAKKMKK